MAPKYLTLVVKSFRYITAVLKRNLQQKQNHSLEFNTGAIWESSCSPTVNYLSFLIWAFVQQCVKQNMCPPYSTVHGTDKVSSDDCHDNTGTTTQVKHQSIASSDAQLKNVDGCALNIILYRLSLLGTLTVSLSVAPSNSNVSLFLPTTLPYATDLFSSCILHWTCE
jgi:hypothetical protein